MTRPKAMTLLALWVCFPLLLDANVNLCESEFVDGDPAEDKSGATRSAL